MRIAFIASSQIPSLTANSIRVMKVCQAFAELGHEIRLWVPRTPAAFDWPAARVHYGLRREFPIDFVEGAAWLRRWDVAMRSAQAASRWKPDLHYVWPYQAAAYLSLAAQPTAIEVHDRPSGLAGPLLFRGFLAGRGAMRVLPITESLRAALEKEYGPRIRPPFARVLPSGVDLAAYDGMPSPRTARAKLGLPEMFTATYTGHLYSGRGLDLMAALAARNPGVSFIWAGGKPDDVDAWRERLQLEGIRNVHLMGFVPNSDLPMLHAASDVLLMPYAKRIAVSSGGDTAAYASPMKTFEYMAAGRAILSSDLPVFGEVLNAGNAVLLPPEDVDAWDRALQAMQADDGRREALGAQARREAAAYDWKARAGKAIEGLEPGSP
ncbi:MAG TPA: glycosyltransferase [Anaerolineales bacterium]|nr:glycosyltransferase [Anaerolineales bacterium]